MKKILVAGLGAGVGMLAFAAMAATEVTSAGVTAPAVVNIPWGGWVQGIAQTVSPYLVSIAASAITAGVGMVAPWAKLFISRSRVEQAVQGVVDYGINATLGAAKGQVLSVPVASDTMRSMVNYAIKNVPDAVIKASGGWESFVSMAFRSLNLDGNATASQILTPVLNDLRSKGLIK